MSFCLRTVLPAAALVFAAAVVTSCGEEEFEGNVFGNALMSVTNAGKEYRVTTVHPGDKVNLRIGATTEKPMQIDIVTISKIVYFPEVHYVIDGKEVGMSNDYKSAFSLPYEIKDLVAGEHTLSVDIPQIYKNIFYNTDIQSTTFTVADDEGAE